MKLLLTFFASLLTFATAQLAIADDHQPAPGAANHHVVDQKNKKFSVKAMQVKVGDKVTFQNQDPFFHNIFSLSDTSTFDLGSYPKGEARSVTMENPGLVDVECAIHPSMHMTIEVTE